MYKSKCPLLNRELSWLEFNERILDQARDNQLPLLERVKFLSISASNLDEFFMVRIGGLLLLIDDKIEQPDPSGLTPQKQIDAIYARVGKMIKCQYDIFLELLEPALKKNGIIHLRPQELSATQLCYAENYFMNEIYPVLSQIALSAKNELPLLFNKVMYILVRLKGTDENPETPRFAVVPVGKTMNRFVTLPSSEPGISYILIEDLIVLFASKLFTGEPLYECIPFRITRNADLSVREDCAGDLLTEMEHVIDARKRSDCVRLETVNTISEVSRLFLQEILEIDMSRTQLLTGPIDLSAFMKIGDFQDDATLKYPLQIPQKSPDIDQGKKMFDIIARKTLLLLHPYESFEPVVRFIDEAADDPDVITIKQILYRTSRTSPIVSALIRAAEKGKNVTVLVELKARFDEERNIEWAKELEDSGVQVVYGVRGLKTHAKVCLVIRREPQGLVRYMHFGTGNYNETTAHLYSDVSYMTCNEELGADTSTFFNAITGYSQPLQYRSIEMAPVGLRDKLLDMIENEIEHKRQGHTAFIRAKMNSLVDPELIDALYKASRAGVKIDLNVRGICCCKVGVNGLSDNITVISIVDRYLEHSRIFHFCHGGDNKIFISTADWMPRNLDKRIELMVPVDNKAAKKRLIETLNTYFSDNVNSWKLNTDGTYVRLKKGARKKAIRSQDVLYTAISLASQLTKRSRRTVFEPHKPLP